MMHRWTTTGHDRLAMPGAKPRHTHFADRAVYDYSARAWLNVFLERWIGGAEDRADRSLSTAAD
jgi:GMP synthase (glutamine-hydrolysing)